MAKYRKKPVVIEAVQFNKDTFIDVLAFMEGKDRNVIVKSANAGGDRFFEYEEDCIKNGLKLKTPESGEGTQIASLGDWIIKGVEGEFYPCKPHIFEKTYEAVE